MSKLSRALTFKELRGSRSLIGRTIILTDSFHGYARENPFVIQRIDSDGDMIARGETRFNEICVYRPGMKMADLRFVLTDDPIVEVEAEEEFEEEQNFTSCDMRITLDEFIASETAKLSKFHDYWKHQQTLPKSLQFFPEKMNPGDWDKQFHMFDETETPKYEIEE